MNEWINVEINVRFDLQWNHLIDIIIKTQIHNPNVENNVMALIVHSLLQAH